VNLLLILHERSQVRIEQASGPAAARIADGLEREASGRRLTGEHFGRLRRTAANPIAATLERKPEIARELREKLAALGIAAGAIDAAIQPTPADRFAWARAHHRPPPNPYELVVAVAQPGRGWLVLRGPWPEDEGWLIWRIVAQTVVLYLAVLIPVLWIARRMSRPLRALADAARTFSPGEAATPLAEAGPADVRAVTAAFNALRLRVAAMLSEKDRMLGAIGHDLRTPLAALRVRIESVEDDDDRIRMAETIDEMSQTLDDILSLARLGRSSEPPVEVDLGALVEAVVEDFRDLEAPVTFAEPPRLTIRLRPSLMRRAVRNLIENAIKYGQVAHVALDIGEARVAVVVRDEGPGIPDDRLADVFDPFTRLETSRNRHTGGAGLGLALAQAIVREAGGQIALANRAEGGLEARITLPR
jgi:signal transduction histidine kinase